MSLFERVKEKRISLNEQPFSDKQKSDMKKLLNKNFGSKEISKKTADTQKNLSKANKEVFNVTGKSAVRDAKKYSSGEYPKIGGGQRIGSKSKGPGAETGAKVNLNPTSGSKSKGTTPVKVNITKPIKQSEVSKKAKVFTQKIDKKKIVKDADRLVRKAEKGDNKARKKILKTVTKKFKKLSPADQQIQLTKMADIQKKMGRKLNPKTGNFEGPDTKFQKSISKIKDSKGKRITSGPVSVTAGPEIRKRVEKIRDTRATKAGMPDPFKSTTKFSQKQFNKTLKSRGVKVPQVPLIPDPFGKGDTKGQMNVKGLEAKAFKKTQPKDVKLPKSFTDFSKKLKTLKTDVAKTASATPRTVTKKYKPTTTVKQSEVSKKAKDFTTKVNQARTKKVTTTTTASAPKTPSVFKRVTAATSGKKVTNSKGIGNKFRGKENIAARNAEIVKRGGSVTGGGGKPPKKPPTKSGIFGFFDPDKKPRNIVKKLGPDSTGKVNLFRSGQSKYGANPIVKVLKKSKNPLAKQAYKTGLKLGPGGRALVKKGGLGGVAVAGLLSSPTVRKFAKGALTGAGIGFLAGNKKEAKPKAVLSPEVKIRTKRFSLSPGEKGGFTDVKYPKKS